MDGEIIEALLKASLPLGLLSFILYRWSYKTGRLDGSGDRKARKAEMKALRKGARKKNAKTKNPVHNKWMKFGGGFYGLVGMWTFLVVEVLEVYDFATGYEGMDGLVDTLSTLSVFGLLIEFFINSLKNFITAVAWPGYWPDVLQSGQIWVWLLAAYGGYWIGMKAARKLTPSTAIDNDPSP